MLVERENRARVEDVEVHTESTSPYSVYFTLMTSRRQVHVLVSSGSCARIKVFALPACILNVAEVGSG